MLKRIIGYINTLLCLHIYVQTWNFSYEKSYENQCIKCWKKTYWNDYYLHRILNPKTKIDFKRAHNLKAFLIYKSNKKILYKEQQRILNSIEKYG